MSRIVLERYRIIASEEQLEIIEIYEEGISNPEVYYTETSQKE